MISFAISDDCPIDYIQIEKNCYYQDHINVLQDFIDYNEILKDFEPQNIGIQEWKNGKLTYFYLGNHQILTIPDKIELIPHK